MNTFQPGENIDDIGQKLMENLSEQLLPLFDMTDSKTSNNYWALMAICGAGVAAQIKAASQQAQMVRLVAAPKFAA